MEINLKRVYNNITETIGSTPMIKLNLVPKIYNVNCQMYGKLEMFNPGESIKDRIALKMILDAEEKGLIKKGDTIIEASAGNTGMGLALVGKQRGYKVIITIPDMMSNEKINRLKALGAEVVVCPTERSHADHDSYCGIAHTLSKKPNHFYINQYENPANPLAHYEHTMIEILEQMDNKIDYIFIGAGSGGTITGIGQYIKEKGIKTKVIGIDPIGSIVARPESLNIHPLTLNKMAGIGAGEIFKTMDLNVVDEWVKTWDKESFICTRDIILYEGLFIGGSCGAALIGAFKYLKDRNLHKDKNIRCVVILPESSSNHLSKCVLPQWMVGCGFMDPNELKNEKNPLNTKFMKDFPWIRKIHVHDENKSLPIEECLKIFNNSSEVVVLIRGNKFSGVIDKESLVRFALMKNLGKKGDARACKRIDVFAIPTSVSFDIV